MEFRLKCGNCGNENAIHLTIRYDASGKSDDVCDRCGGDRRSAIPTDPDVYWPGHAHYNPNVCDRMGRPIYLTSKSHKAEVLKKLHMQEAGDVSRGNRRGDH